MLHEPLSILQAGQFQANITGMERNAFGEMIRAARERKGLRAYELAPLIGKQPSFVSRLETGVMKETPDPVVLAALRDHLGLDERAMLQALGYLQDEPRIERNDEEPDPLRDQMTALVRQVRWQEKADHAHGLIRVISGILQDQKHARRRSARGSEQGR